MQFAESARKRDRVSRVTHNIACDHRAVSYLVACISASLYRPALACKRYATGQESYNVLSPFFLSLPPPLASPSRSRLVRYIPSRSSIFEQTGLLPPTIGKQPGKLKQLASRATLPLLILPSPSCATPPAPGPSLHRMSRT